MEPRSIAVVGATDRPSSYGELVLANLERWRFSGHVWGVNPNRREARGFRCFPTVLDLPEPVDAVVIAVPSAAVAGILAEAVELGCGGAVVLSAGFAEVEQGVPLQQQLREVALGGGLPVCGPNGNGIVAAAVGAPMWGDSVQPLEQGPVAMVSQSGNVAVNALGSRRGIGYHTVVSSGNQAVLDASDWLGALATTEGVRSVALFLEADGDGAKLADALALCAERDVGVAVLKVGASPTGAAAAAAHTGALAGDQRIFRALVEEAGGAWARDLHELLELAKVLAEPRARPRGDGGLGILTCSGGDSGVAADEAKRAGLAIPALAARTHRELGRLLPDAATIANPLDYTAMIWGDVERLRRIIVAVGADPAINQLLILYDHPHELGPESVASWVAVREGIIAGAAEAPAATVVASTLPDLIDPEAIFELGAREVPLVAGLATALACVKALGAPTGDASRLREIGHAAAQLNARRRAEDGWLAEAEAKALVRRAGIPTPSGRLARDEADALVAADECGWPVALKVSSPSLRHKCEAGAVALALDGEFELREAFARLSSLEAANGAGILVEHMMPPGVELLVAARTDAVVPALVVGLGGIWAEALDDVAVVPLPADAKRVEAALGTLRGAPVLKGGRGTDGVDTGALASLAARAGELVLEAGLELLELNPVLAQPDGAIALDATAKRHGALG